MDDRKRAALTMAVMALQVVAEPAHYRELHDLMVGVGWEATYAKDPAAQVYGILHEAAREGLDNVVFLGRGKFALSSMPGVSASVAPRVTKRSTSTKLAPPPLARVCGNCRHIEFSGVHVISQESGGCRADERSHRFYVRSDELACQCFSPRSSTQRRTDDAAQQEMMPIINAVNRLSHQGKCWDSVQKLIK